MNVLVKSGLIALALGFAGAAHAGDSEDFAGCDGLKKPKSKDDGMRGQASVPGYSIGILGKRPAGIVAACDRALGGGKVRPEQTLRRAHLLRARAAALLELGETARALADIEAAQAAAASYADDFFYRRSMGLSLDLMRAIALSQTGRDEEALRLAEAAAAERPYALQIQTVASVIRDLYRAPGAASAELWDDLVRLDPGARGIAVSRAIEAGDFATVIALAGTDAAPPAAMPGFAGAGDITQSIGAWANGFNTAMHVAYAHAALGHPAEARAGVEAARARIAEAKSAAAGDKGLRGRLTGLVADKTVEPMALMVEARIAAGEGRLDEARAIIVGEAIPENAAVRDLMRLLKIPPAPPAAPPTGALDAVAAAGPDAVAPAIVPAALEVTPLQARTARLGQLAEMLLVPPESQRTLIDYEKSRPNILGELIGGALSFGTTLLDGIDRTAGFRSTANEDGTVKIEYTGNTVSGPVVQEMTLLRAAELAREGGHAGFAIVDRKDYQRYLTMTQGGFERSRTLTGYKTELTVRWLGAGEAHPAAFDAVAVIDALGPVYYEAG